MAYSFVDLKLLSLIAGLINPYKNFPVACVISQIIFKFCFFQYACLCELCRVSRVSYIESEGNQYKQPYSRERGGRGNPLVYTVNVT